MAARTTNGTKPTRGRPNSRTITVPKQMLVAADDTEVVELPDNDAPVFSTKDSDGNPFSEMEPVFWCDDVCYTAPVRVPASWGLQFVRLKVAYGIDQAVIYSMERALGPLAVQKLTEIPNLSPEQLAVITEKISAKFVAATTVPKG
jgi:hypothetical protein